ncbi:MAG: MFS transporter [Verrucomicrobiota bacterium]
MNQTNGRTRWIICALLFFSVAVNYIDRLVIGILKKPISAELGWSDKDYGYIAAFFSFAYAFGYLIGGRMIDKLGVKKGLPIFVFLWSLAATAHGLVSYVDKTEQFHMNYPWLSFAEGGVVWMTLAMPMTAAGFLLARVALGLTEGANFPAAIKTVAEWYPVKERAFATGLFNAGTNVGAIICPIAVPWMFSHMGWASTFYVTGATGFVWLIAWWFAYDEPENHRWLAKDELNYIRSGQPAVEEKAVKVPWLSLFRYRAVWAYVIASILAGPAWGFYQFFVPDFLDKRFASPIVSVGDINQLPALASELNNSANPASIYVRDSLSPETKTALANYQANDATSTLQTALAADLTRVVDGPSLFDENRFQTVELRQETKERREQLLSNPPKDEKLRQLKLSQSNRLLLEDIFPTGLNRMLSLQSIGGWTGAFFGIAAIGGIVGGWLAGSLLGRGWTLNAARKVSLLICALCVVPVFFAPFAPTVLLAVLIVGLAGAAHQGWSANLFSVVSDTMPKDAISSTIGLGGFVAYFTGGFVNGITGEILQKTGSYVSVFAYFSGTYLLSLLAIQLLIPKIRDTRQEPVAPLDVELKAGHPPTE